MVVDEGVPTKLTGTETARAGETGLSTRGGAAGIEFGTSPELICPVIRKVGAGPVLNSIPFPARVTKSTKDSKKGKVKKDKKKQNQSKTDKKQKRQDKSKEIANDQSRISPMQEKEVNEAQNESQGPMLASF
ncbi:hypothetical protein Tco_1432931 [Tanacetum coccineum]